MRSLAAAAAVLGVLAAPAAQAGPCTSQIAQLDRDLSQSPALGPPTTGTLAGAAPGIIKPGAIKPGAAIKPGGQPPAQASAAGTSATGTLGGTGGTKEMSAASNQIATSAQDVRRQQEGKPTMAAATAAPASGSIETKPGTAATPQAGRLSEAKMDVSQARALDAKGDSACMNDINRARSLMQHG